MGGFHKKADAGLTILLIVVIVILLFGVLINFGRECRTNKDCGSESYCGSDFACHQYPTIQKTVVQYNLFLPAVILGIAIVFAAWILRKEQKTEVQAKVQEQVEIKPQEVEDISEPYYKPGNIKTP
ncbi:hypothetical protein HYX02_07165 [Candidatus Woesearchaeota archaeon]|nr:hypothetical protein [Candidatus Woesearchaeota archaeon]